MKLRFFYRELNQYVYQDMGEYFCECHGCYYLNDSMSSYCSGCKGYLSRKTLVRASYKCQVEWWAPWTWFRKTPGKFVVTYKLCTR